MMNGKKTPRRQPGRHGFTMVEVLIAIVIVGITVGTFMMMQKRSWMRTARATKIMEAGHKIEHMIEKLRIHVAKDPDNNFPPADSSFTEKGITIDYTLSQVKDPDGVIIPNVRNISITASWGSTANDTLLVTGKIAKQF